MDLRRAVPRAFDQRAEGGRAGPGSSGFDAGMLLLRLVVGLTMAAHGAQKLLGWFGGPGFAAERFWATEAVLQELRDSGPRLHRPSRATLSSIREGSRLERAFRDIYTGTQHAFISEKVAMDSAQIWLGVIEDQFGLPYLGYAGQKGLNHFGTDVFNAGV